MIQVKVENVFFSNKGFVVLLRGESDQRTLPIFVGAQEAQSIAIKLGNVEVPRPMTHDLFKSVLELLGCRLIKIEVCDLRDNTFIGKLYLEQNGKKMEVDTRPSDAIALALRFAAAIYVSEKVMNEAGVVLKGESTEPKEETPEGPAEEEALRENLTPLQMLEKRLAAAIREEKYEDAAKIRDELRKMRSNN
jgi:bifunctional DNase/RNase